MTQDPYQRLEAEEVAREKLPVYELHAIVRLANEEALKALMMKMAELLYTADPMTVFGGGEKQSLCDVTSTAK